MQQVLIRLLNSQPNAWNIFQQFWQTILGCNTHPITTAGEKNKIPVFSRCFQLLVMALGTRTRQVNKVISLSVHTKIEQHL